MAPTTSSRLEDSLTSCLARRGVAGGCSASSPPVERRWSRDGGCSCCDAFTCTARSCSSARRAAFKRCCRCADNGNVGSCIAGPEQQTIANSSDIKQISTVRSTARNAYRALRARYPKFCNSGYGALNFGHGAGFEARPLVCAARCVASWRTGMEPTEFERLKQALKQQKDRQGRHHFGRVSGGAGQAASPASFSTTSRCNRSSRFCCCC